ncbi:fungal-specific transcription factor domain-containing protein [Tricharina praecox]|uniref:fungal-specific transcription factor domain-containing protein n=1 Tax=Tricharina praecox TaxID=43433 RepID=UPI002220C538|nr:fungal-specific transcription factor domain-containing protein [Tricharina praecox]KAI5853544.1 fungal-specific transcription factor domain-containing protein [Tricharina praecox]
MQRERRTLSVPTISYEDVDQQQDLEMVQQHGFLGTAPSPSPSPSSLTAAAVLGATSGWPPQPHPGQAPSPSFGHNHMATLGKPHVARSRSASTSSLSTPTPGTPSLKKKIVTACQRCRTRKIRCDGALPACRSCVKAGVECIEVDRAGDNNMPRSHVLELENRIKWLEDIVRAQCPEIDLSIGPTVELRSRPAPPAIRIVTTGPDFHQPLQCMSSTSSPVFALSPASTCATPVSFEFSSPGVSPGYLQPMSPFTFSEVGPSRAPSPAPASPLMLAQDTPALPHEVCLLALSAAEEPKYFGSSSGVNFARMVFADDRGDLQDGDLEGLERHTPVPNVEPAPLPSMEECAPFFKTYFESVHLQYPFLHQPTFEACLQAVCQARGHDDAEGLPPGFSAPVARFQAFIVLSIGAHILSTRAGGNFNSEGYYAAAMQLAGDVSLTGSLQGAQNALLLAMHSLYATGGRNVWYLNAIIMATCIDLGLQRKFEMPGDQGKAAVKRRVFWCAYSLDRNLGIALGRPFSLRDESLDVEFPQDTDNDEELANPSHSLANSKSIGASRTLFSCSVFVFKIMKIISSIKSMLYRVSPSTGTWDIGEWQIRTYQQLLDLQEQARSSLTGIRRGTGSPSQVAGTQLVELKVHEAIQLLFRPSPIIVHPTSFALDKCFHSAVETVRIYFRPKRYNETPYHPYTRLTENSIFLAGITMLYSHRTCQEVRAKAGGGFLAEEIRCCSQLLADLSQLWPTAQKSKTKFDSLAHSTLAYSSATASSRMLSPHDGARRASGGSVRSFAESQTLEVPSLTPSVPPAAPPSSPMPNNGWYGAEVGVPPGSPSPNLWVTDPGWDLQQTTEDFMINEMEGIQRGTDLDILANLMNDDTAMWGMGPLEQQQQQQQQR